MGYGGVCVVCGVGAWLRVYVGGGWWWVVPNAHVVRGKRNTVLGHARIQGRLPHPDPSARREGRWDRHGRAILNGSLLTTPELWQRARDRKGRELLAVEQVGVDALEHDATWRTTAQRMLDGEGLGV